MSKVIVLLSITEHGTKVIAVFDSIQTANYFAVHFNVPGWNTVEVPHLRDRA